MKIQGFEFEYDDDSHTYIVDGVIVPSITKVVGSRFPNKYSDVDPDVLREAAERGTRIHKEIEEYCTEGKKGKSDELRNFIFLEKKYPLEVRDNEVPVLVTKDGRPVCAGRLDLIVSIDGKLSVADIKTTSALDKLYLEYQLNLYRIGYMQSYGIYIDGLYGIHLRGDIRRVCPIPIDEVVAWNLIRKYEEESE